MVKCHWSTRGPSLGTTEAVLGVDTHRDFHVAAVLAMTGRTLGIERFPATANGYRQLFTWACQWGDIRCAGVESSGTYGAALSRYLLSQGIEVVEAPGPGRSARCRRSKSDRADAEAAARAVLSGRAHSPVKSGSGPAETARIYIVAKDSAVKAQRQAANQLKAILVTADPALREELATLSRRALVRACLELSEGDYRTDPVVRATRFTLRALAERIEQLRAQARALECRLTDLIQCHHPRLVDAVGIGPHSAAVLLTVMGDNSDRLRGEASFAALCGASPVEYSSGNRQHCRLNRGGNRQANAALHRIVLSRLRWDARTRAYYERRVTEGKTRREVIRCLKRYVAREVYRLVQEDRRSLSCTPALTSAVPR
ncbi:IS110 family transposase [Streptomyces paromomycinus]|uniref:IS110 family transposase n=1 Tax=Streptomyces paromomycinus TaxID=92743 RepID=UPI000F61D974|nr:IS110 family transposase [Streptomyces paromomycinus]